MCVMLFFFLRKKDRWTLGLCFPQWQKIVYKHYLIHLPVLIMDTITHLPTQMSIREIEQVQTMRCCLTQTKMIEDVTKPSRLSNPLTLLSDADILMS